MCARILSTNSRANENLITPAVLEALKAGQNLAGRDLPLSCRDSTCVLSYRVLKRDASYLLRQIEAGKHIARLPCSTTVACRKRRKELAITVAVEVALSPANQSRWKWIAFVGPRKDACLATGD